MQVMKLTKFKKSSIFVSHKKYLNQWLTKWKKVHKINQYFKLIIKEVIMYELVIALLVKRKLNWLLTWIWKDKGVKMVKKTLTVEQ